MHKIPARYAVSIAAGRFIQERLIKRFLIALQGHRYLPAVMPEYQDGCLQVSQGVIACVALGVALASQKLCVVQLVFVIVALVLLLHVAQLIAELQ